MNGTCAGAGGATLANAFRIGVDGNTAPLPAVTQTLPQPFFPGAIQNGIQNPAAADGSRTRSETAPQPFERVHVFDPAFASSKIG